MGFWRAPIPPWLDWINVVIGVLGTLLTVWAALSARGARRAAQDARRAAERAGNWLQMADLVDDLAELRLLLHERHFELIATKSGRVRGRIVRLKRRIYNDLDASSREALDRARDLLENVADESLNRRTIDETKIERIQRALSDADEAFNLLLGQLEPPREE